MTNCKSDTITEFSWENPRKNAAGLRVTRTGARVPTAALRVTEGCSAASPEKVRSSGSSSVEVESCTRRRRIKKTSEEAVNSLNNFSCVSIPATRTSPLLLPSVDATPSEFLPS